MTIPAFWNPTRLHFNLDGDVITEEYPVPQNITGITDEGFQYEISHFNQCVREGLTESPVIPLQKSLSIIEQCDRLRAQWNLRYPFE